MNTAYLLTKPVDLVSQVKHRPLLTTCGKCGTPIWPGSRCPDCGMLHHEARMPRKAEPGQESPVTPEAKKKLAEATIKTLGDLMRVCNVNWKMTTADVCRELNVRDLSQLAITPAQAYIQIAAVREGAPK